MIMSTCEIFFRALTFAQWEVSSVSKKKSAHNLHRVCNFNESRQHIKVKQHLHWQAEVLKAQFPHIARPRAALATRAHTRRRQWEVSSVSKKKSAHNLHRVCNFNESRQHIKVKQHLHWQAEVLKAQFPHIARFTSFSPRLLTRAYNVRLLELRRLEQDPAPLSPQGLTRADDV
ncbi:hypothetical protein KSP40_PGU022295 [Platanthera guangdongensis]|uniref:Uncharacterized protein n=1 Tax=Platanthera guangdongensis TaxID=2320717 RepID=A0ABR2N4R8_9ASPA